MHNNICKKPTIIPLIKLTKYIYPFKVIQETELIKTQQPIINKY